MASLPTALVLLSALLSGFTYAVAVGGLRGAVEPVMFDYFTLSLQWPATSCAARSKTCCRENRCCPGTGSPPPGFTIMGLWPDYSDGSYPSCCPGPAYNETEISPLLGTMEKYWPLLSCKQTQSCIKKRPFWAHQWEKHGTCSTLVTENQYQYFLTSIELYLEYNVTDVLTKAGIVPSNTKTYPLTSITSAIEKAFNAPPQVTCNKDAIKEVRLCFTKEHMIRECVGDNKCPEYVMLPEFAFRNVTKSTEDWLISTVGSIV